MGDFSSLEDSCSDPYEKQLIQYLKNSASIEKVKSKIVFRGRNGGKTVQAQKAADRKVDLSIKKEY